jgi:hypothetical protein
MSISHGDNGSTLLGDRYRKCAICAKYAVTGLLVPEEMAYNFINNDRDTKLKFILHVHV